MTEEGKIACPVCRHECRQTSILCPECGVQFENWLRDNPGQSLPGWKPSTGAGKPEPVPAPATPEPETPLTPEAREALLIQQMENTVRRRSSPSAKAGRKAGALMMTLAVGNIAMAVILKAAGMSTNNNGLVLGTVDALVLGPLSLGTYAGKRKWGLAGIGWIAISTVISLLFPGPEITSAEMNLGAVSAASSALGNIVVMAILYWFIRKMEK
jgi:hypothetical protein